MRLSRCAVVHAGPVRRHHERHLPEVAGLEPSEDVVPPGALPPHQVVVGDQDGAGALKAACPAREAIQGRRLVQERGVFFVSETAPLLASNYVAQPALGRSK